jgi:hypothetical protein
LEYPWEISCLARRHWSSRNQWLGVQCRCFLNKRCSCRSEMQHREAILDGLKSASLATCSHSSIVRSVPPMFNFSVILCLCAEKLAASSSNQTNLRPPRTHTHQNHSKMRTAKVTDPSLKSESTPKLMQQTGVASNEKNCLKPNSLSKSDLYCPEATQFLITLITT